MHSQHTCRALVGIAFAWLAFGAGGASGADLPAPAAEVAAFVARPCPSLSLEHLARLSCCELEQLYRQAEATPLPDGYVRGRAIYCPDRPLSGARSSLTNFLWRGKLLDAAGCSLVNQWLGFRAIKARIYLGTSWLDGKPSVIMDYRGTSRVWSDVRDEVREVAPGLFLGAMFRSRRAGPEFQLFFALQAPSARECPGCPPADSAVNPD